MAPPTRGDKKKRDAKGVAKLDYSKLQNAELVRAMKPSSGWKVSTKTEARASFFRVSDNGTEFISTNGTHGGKVRILLLFCIG
jgi:hypothetical protein